MIEHAMTEVAARFYHCYRASVKELMSQSHIMTKAGFAALFKDAVDKCAPLRKDTGDPASPIKRTFDISSEKNIKNPLFREHLWQYLANGHSTLNYAPILSRFWFGGTPAREITLSLSEVTGSTAVIKLSVSQDNADVDETPKIIIL